MSWAPTEGDSEMQNWKVQPSVKRVVLHDSGIGVKNEIIGYWRAHVNCPPSPVTSSFVTEPYLYCITKKKKIQR